MKNFKHLVQTISTTLLYLGCIWSSLVCADTPRASPPSLGGAASNVLGPLAIFTNALYNICFILGAAFIFGGFIRYKEYRENPSQTPISRAIAVIIFGVVFIAIPIIAKLSESSPT